MSSHEHSGAPPAAAESYDNFIKYEGFWYTPSFLEIIKAAQNEFMAQDSDIIICSYPKAGTTWLKALTFAIMTRGEVKVTNFEPTTTVANSSSKNPLLVLNPHECVPFIEGKSNKKNQNSDPSLSSIMKKPKERIFSTHISYTSLPNSVLESRCKIVYICRDPKDVMVSFWHFGREQLPWVQGITFHEMFEKFCEGRELYGPIWDHVLTFWNAAKEQPGKILFLKYEALKSQTTYYVKELAEFIGKPFSREEEKSGQIDKIIELCSLEHLRNLEVNQNGSFSTLGIEVDFHSFFRKGRVGDWKSHLTPEMKERLDTIIQDKFKGTGLNILG